MSTAVGPVDSDFLGRVQADAVERNTASGVSGLLLYRSGRYFHFLEGPPAAIDAALDEVAHDHNHTHLRVLCSRQSRVRVLKNWNMGVLNHEPPAPERDRCLTALEACAEIMNIVDTDEEADTVIRIIMRCFERFAVRAQDETEHDLDAA